MSPIGLMLTAFSLLLLGVILPFLMVIHIVESTFFMNFFSYTMSLIGLILGIIGASRYSGNNRK